MSDERSPIILLSLDSLVEVLRDEGVRSKMSKAVKVEQFNLKSIKALASEIALTSVKYSIPSDIIEINLRQSVFKFLERSSCKILKGSPKICI